MGQRQDRELADRALTEPAPDRLAADHPHRTELLAEHAAALHEKAPMYRDPATGLFVLTAKYLADRGFCCDNGCRHCPYARD